MAGVPHIRELERLCGGEGRGIDEPRDVRTYYARLVRRLSIRITWLLLHTRASAGQVTVAGIVVGIGGGALLASDNVWVQIAAVAALQLSFVLDFSDGEIARFRGATGAGGAYLDWIGHYYVPAAAAAALGFAAWRQSGENWVLVAGFVVALGAARIAYSARDHVLLGLFRDRPELRQDPEFVRAVLARQGGDPDLVAVDADPGRRRAGAPGRGLMWHRYTNLGQLLVYPGFVNLVTVAVAIDAIASVAAGHYPRVEETTARMVLLGVLGLVQLLHQLRAAGQGHAILRRLG